ncbi:MAG: methyltransferase domain-containing protein [Helicobacteraceae bacterium]|nr:methyltransferase domain-containing protein [Helicobacteraceae bacterium]
MHFKKESMFEIVNSLKTKLNSCDHVSFNVLNPDVCDSTYSGTIVEFDDVEYIYRSYRAYLDLAILLFCKMRTPKLINKNIVSLEFVKLNTQSSFHNTKLNSKSEKYGVESHFFNIQKNEEPFFITHYTQALENVNISSRLKVLNLGVNRADEFEVIKEIVGDEVFNSMELTGVDHSQSAIKYAKKKFPTKTFYEKDLNSLDDLSLGKFDLIISIGTLQSPSINFKPFFNSLVQNYLNKGGSVILGFPNSRWIDGEMIYGAKMANYSESDLSLVIKDIHYVKKYLQQKKFRVRVSGREYIFLSATNIKATDENDQI